jgi:small subunit ribosomal protein S19
MAGKRSVWKGPFIDKHLLAAVQKVAASGKNLVIKTWSRRSTILPMFVGYTVSVYNGRKFIPVLVTAQMVGKKFGEFAPTRTFTGHGANKKAVRV